MITLYTTGCPNCKILQGKLESNNIPYLIVSDVNTMKQKGIKSTPMLETDDGHLLTFFQAVKFCNEYQH